MRACVRARTRCVPFGPTLPTGHHCTTHCCSWLLAKSLSRLAAATSPGKAPCILSSISQWLYQRCRSLPQSWCVARKCIVNDSSCHRPPQCIGHGNTLTAAVPDCNPPNVPGMAHTARTRSQLTAVACWQPRQAMVSPILAAVTLMAAGVCATRSCSLLYLYTVPRVVRAHRR